MNFRFKADNVSITMYKSGPHVLTPRPALAINVKEYEVSGDMTQLIECIQELGEKVQAAAFGVPEDQLMTGVDVEAALARASGNGQGQ